MWSARPGARAAKRPTRGRAKSVSDSPERRHHEADERFNPHVPMARQKEGRQEVPVEPFLIGCEGAGQERATERMRPRSRQSHAQAFGPRALGTLGTRWIQRS